jgi:hypothetical protein
VSEGENQCPLTTKLPNHPILLSGSLGPALQMSGC